MSAKITTKQIDAADKALERLYSDPVWGLKASEDDAVFAVLQAVWPELYANADYEKVMRDGGAIEAATQRIWEINCGPTSGRDLIIEMIKILTPIAEANREEVQG